LSDDVSPRAPIRVAALQFEPNVGDRSHNLAVMERLIRQAHVSGADLVVLPELADSGYVFESAEELARLAAPIPGGESASRLCDLAAELGIHIVSGLAEREGDIFYNAAVLCGPSGIIGKYRKLHLWNEENTFFLKGDLDLPVFETPLGSIGIAICYDGWFPETFRALALAGAELICVPTNWVPMPGAAERDLAMATILHQAAAHSNGVYIACADRVGTERGQAFIGRSLIVGPQGWPCAGPASSDQEEILLADVDLGNVAGSRSLNAYNHVLRDRRDDVYG